MIRPRMIVPAAMLAALAGPSLPAQDSVAVGSRVMVRVTSEHVREAQLRLQNRTFAGRLIATTGDSLVVSTERDSITVPRGAIERLWVSARASRRGLSAAKGAAIGLGTGFAFGLIAGEDCSDSDFICFDRGELAMALGLAGAGAGALAGAAFGGERWREIRPMRASLSIFPAGRGAVAAVLTIRP